MNQFGKSCQVVGFVLAAIVSMWCFVSSNAPGGILSLLFGLLLFGIGRFVVGLAAK